MEKYLIIHYGELGLKGGNKEYFQSVLRKNVIMNLRAIGIKSDVQLILGRFVSKIPAKFSESVLYDAMMHIPGIENFGFFCKTDMDFEKIGKALVKHLPRKEIKEKGLKTFCVRVKKSQEKMPFDRLEAERDFGAILIENDIGLNVKLDNPDLSVLVEVFGDDAYFTFHKFRGLGGLPVGTAGKVLSLISSGFDSPVAAFRMMKRGAKVCFVHFSGQPYSKKEESEHVKEIVKILSHYQSESRLFIVPFGEIQKKISINLKVPAGLRVVLYRRLMLKIAEKIAFKERAKALVTGESLGQVASQTLINIATINNAVELPILRPLIGMDKEEIIAESVKIGTHDISKLPCTDTCSLFTPKAPETAAKIDEVQEVEKAFDGDKFVENAVGGAEKFIL